MAKVHTLEIYQHLERSCPGCFEATEQPAPDPAEGSDGRTGAGGPAAGAGPAPAPKSQRAADASPLGDAHLIEVRVLNASAAPEPRVAFDARLPDGSTRSGATGADGFIRMSVTPQTGPFRLVLPDHEPPEGTRPPPSAAPGAVPYARDGVELAIGTSASVQLPPRVFRGRLAGILFDTDKAFLLPGSLPALRDLKRLYDEHPRLAVLVVGHADTTGNDAHNLTVSVERAEAVAAFLGDQFEEWLPWYGAGKPATKRWGAREDQLMLSVVTDGTAPFYAGPIDGIAGGGTREAVRRFQTWASAQRGAGLRVDGAAGENTRRALVKAYMELDDTRLPADTTLATHGCGEFHPEIPTADGVSEPRNRRVEIFLFEGPIDPPPRTCTRPGCAEHPEWVRRLADSVDLTGGPEAPARPTTLKLRLLDGGAPRASQRWRIDVAGVEVAEGTTDAEGRLSASVPANPGATRLVLPDDGSAYSLEVGTIAPLEETAGVQSRLFNLGYGCKQDGTLDEETRGALRAFQKDHDLPLSGTVDAATRDALRTAHGS